ncbi:hypothetical protein D3C78_1876270 [compost metagenome]
MILPSGTPKIKEAVKPISTAASALPSLPGRATFVAIVMDTTTTTPALIPIKTREAFRSAIPGST